MIVSVPAGSVVIVSEAEPPTSEAVPSVVVPFSKLITSPLGGVPPAELTVAVSVTAWLTSDGLRDDVSVVMVVKMFTTDWLRAVETLAALFVSPL